MYIEKPKRLTICEALGHYGSLSTESLHDDTLTTPQTYMIYN
jgi:hypothetical protein